MTVSRLLGINFDDGHGSRASPISQQPQGVLLVVSFASGTTQSGLASGGVAECIRLLEFLWDEVPRLLSRVRELARPGGGDRPLRAELDANRVPRATEEGGSSCTHVLPVN